LTFNLTAVSFTQKKHIIKKFLLKISLAEYKNICLLYHKHKKEVKLLKDKQNIYYRKKVDIVNDIPTNKKIVYYQQVKEKKNFHLLLNLIWIQKKL